MYCIRRKNIKDSSASSKFLTARNTGVTSYGHLRPVSSKQKMTGNQTRWSIVWQQKYFSFVPLVWTCSMALNRACLIKVWKTINSWSHIVKHSVSFRWWSNMFDMIWHSVQHQHVWSPNYGWIGVCSPNISFPFGLAGLQKLHFSFMCVFPFVDSSWVYVGPRRIRIKLAKAFFKPKEPPLTF